MIKPECLKQRMLLARITMAYIKASEIGNFVFCERFWWLDKHNYFGELSMSEEDVSAERLEAGIEYHRDYSKNVRSVSASRNLARILIIISALLLIFALFSIFMGSADAEPPKHQKGTLGVTVTTRGFRGAHAADTSTNIAVLAAVGAIVLSVTASALKRSARAKQRRWRMPKGKVISVDDGKGRTLTCPKLELVGKIDVILRDGAWFMPEEQKSTILKKKTPMDGDVLQVFAYCYLISQNLGPVQKGILIYQNGPRFDLEFSQEAMNRLMKVLQQIKGLQSARDVNRSHESRARCMNCKAQRICFQALA